jgi:predicted nucleotidyltransferase
MLTNLKNISPLSKEIISFLIEIASNNKVDRIFVFGSRSFGDYERYSDLDLAIDAPSFTKYEWLKLKEFVIYDLRTILRISLVHYSSNPQKLKDRITKTGKIIYAKHS